MADVFIEDGERYGKTGKKTLVHVVRGDKGPQSHKAGQILDTYFSRNGENHLLDVKWVLREGIRVAVEEIRIKPHYRRLGWTTLQDAYISEGNEAGFEEYLEFSAQQRRDPVGMRGVEFPEEKLPQVVRDLLARRADDKAETARWKKASKPKAAAKPAPKATEKRAAPVKEKVDGTSSK